MNNKIIKVAISFQKALKRERDELKLHFIIIRQVITLGIVLYLS